MYTTHATFTYKGTENDDKAVFSGVFEKVRQTVSRILSDFLSTLCVAREKMHARLY